MSENNQMMSVEGQLVGMPLAGPESFSQQQLEYLKRAMGIDETVLYNDSVGTNNNVNLSEAMSNFERIKIVWKDWSSYPCIHVQEFLSSSDYFVIDGIWAGSGNNKLLFWGLAYVPNSSKTVLTTHFARQLTAPGDTQTYGAQNTMILKVVGIHRIAGGNQ